jgi:hypothetical protein
VRLIEAGEGLVKTERDLVFEVSGQPGMFERFLGGIPLVGLDLGNPMEEVMGESA